jgi:hypothetical protein
MALSKAATEATIAHLHENAQSETQRLLDAILDDLNALLMSPVNDRLHGAGMTREDITATTERLFANLRDLNARQTVSRLPPPTGSDRLT